MTQSPITLDEGQCHCLLGLLGWFGDVSYVKGLCSARHIVVTQGHWWFLTFGPCIFE